MTPRQVANIPASVRQRLLNLAQERHEDYNLVLNRYAAERFLYRLSKTEHANNYVLKGATLFAVWTATPHRPTRDLDLTGYGDPSQAHLAQVIRDVCAVADENDGMTFNAAAVTIEPIRDDQEYGGLRVRLDAVLGTARIPVQVDVGFGEAIVPTPITEPLPTLLGTNDVSLRIYPKEAVIAEKLHAMVVLGMANSRMKDLFDIHTLARTFTFEGAILLESIQATFKRRATEFPATVPLALTAEFATDADKQVQWQAFLNRTGLQRAHSLEGIVEDIRSFLEPPLSVAAVNGTFDAHWSPEEGWSHA